MKDYTVDEIQENYNTFIETLTKVFSGERLKKLLYMYSESELGNELAIAPASGKAHFHSSYPGGYIDHVMNVVRNANNMLSIFKQDFDGDLGFTPEELFFSAFHHDLGKLGDGTLPLYTPETSDWHRKNQNSNYKFSPDIHHMDVTDRALFLLQKYGITFSENEMLGIKLADGMYNEAAVPYLKTYNPDQSLKTVLPNLVHWADHMSCRQEFLNWKESEKTKNIF